MHYVTDRVSPNESCYGLVEGHELAPVPGGKNGETDWRWIQKVFVVRGDTISKYITDFGPSEDFELITPIFIPNQGTDSVAVLQAMAEKNRHDTYWQMRAKAQLEESTLITDLMEQEAKIHEVIRNRTSSGPYVTNQRNNWSHLTSMRKFKERRQERTGKVVFLT
jgi:hypothetical protein